MKGLDRLLWLCYGNHPKAGQQKEIAEDLEVLIDDSGDVEGAIGRAAADQMLVIIGATERGLLSRLLRGSLAYDVVDEVECSVLLAERPSERSLRERLFGSRTDTDDQGSLRRGSAVMMVRFTLFYQATGALPLCLYYAEKTLGEHETLERTTTTTIWRGKYKCISCEMAKR